MKINLRFLLVVLYVCCLVLFVGCENDFTHDLIFSSQTLDISRSIQGNINIPLYRQGIREIPLGINCSEYQQGSSANSRSGIDLEDVARLRQVAENDLERNVHKNLKLIGFPNGLGEDYNLAIEEILRLNLPTLQYNGHTYKVNTFQMTLADPYLFLYSSNQANVSEVSKGEWLAIKNDLIKINSDSENQSSILKEMLRHADFRSESGSFYRRSLLRKRIKKLYCAAFEQTRHRAESFSNGIFPENEMIPIYGFVKQLEGDNTAHCIDGLDQQISRLELIFLESTSSDHLSNIGMLLSKVFHDYKVKFVERHSVFGQSSSEARTYIPQIIQRRMQLILGLNGPLTELQFPNLVNYDNELSIPSLIKRFYLGEDDFEAFSPQKMLDLLNLAERRAYTDGNPNRIDSNGLDGQGVKIRYSFIDSHLRANQHRGAPFVEILRDIEELIFNGNTESPYVAVDGADIHFKDVFWMEMMIHYGYLVQAD